MSDTRDTKFRILASVIGAQAVDGLKKSVDGVGTSATGLAGKFNTLKTGLSALAGAFAVREVAGFVQGLIDAGDNLRDLSQRTSVSVSDLSGFKVAAEQSGTSIEALAPAFKKFNDNLVKAAGGSREAQAAFKNLGVSFSETDGKARKTGDVVKDIADRFANLKDSPEKAALAVKLFGKAGDEIIPFLNNGSEALSRFNGAISDNFADRADQFNDTLTEIKASLTGAFTKGLEAALPSLQGVLETFRSLAPDTDLVKGAFLTLSEVVVILTAGLRSLALPLVTVGDLIIQLGAGAIDVVVTRFRQLVTGITSTVSALSELATGNFDGAKNAIKTGFEEFNSLGKQLTDNSTDRVDRFYKRLKERSQNYADDMTKLAQSSVLVGLANGKSLEQVLAEQAARTKPTERKTDLPTANSAIGSENAKKIEDEIAKAQLYKQVQLEQLSIEKARIEGYKLSSAELAKLINQKQIEIDVTRATKGATAEGTQAYREAAKAVLDQKNALVDLQEEQKRSYGVGAQEAINDYLESAKDVAAQTKQAFSNAFKGLEDALTEFVTTGQLNFKKFANAILADIARIAVRKAVLEPLIGGISAAFSAGAGTSGAAAAGATPFANGGIMTANGPVPLRKYASGGIANSPQLALYGEGSRPEAFVPLPDGRRIPVDMKGAQGGGNVNVSVVLNVEKGTSETEGQDDKAKSLAVLISNIVKGELVNQKRPGGLLA